MQEQGVKVDRFEITIRGLKVWYRSRAGRTTISYDAFATCNLFQEIGLIEAFDTDGHEPVILYEDINIKPYSKIIWCDFVTCFSFGMSEAQKIAQYHYNRNYPATSKARKKKKNQQQDKIELREVTPPLHLYHLHNYYYEHIRDRKKD